MRWRALLTPSVPMLFAFAALLAIYSVLPLYPVYDQVICMKAPCPPRLLYVPLAGLISTPQLLSVNVPILIAELLVLYVLAAAAAQLLPKKRKRR